MLSIWLKYTIYSIHTTIIRREKGYFTHQARVEEYIIMYAGRQELIFMCRSFFIFRLCFYDTRCTQKDANKEPQRKEMYIYHHLNGESTTSSIERFPVQRHNQSKAALFNSLAPARKEGRENLQFPSPCKLYLL